MTRQERREKWPEVAAWCDDMLAEFDGAEITHVSLPGYEFGKPSDEGVQPNVREKRK